MGGGWHNNQAQPKEIDEYISLLLLLLFLQYCCFDFSICTFLELTHSTFIGYPLMTADAVINF